MSISCHIEDVMMFQTVTKQFVRRHVYLKEDRIYHISESREPKMKADKTINGQGLYMVPGFIDCHMHIESSMCVPDVFSDAVLEHGVTTVIADAHEMANVFGLEGLEYFMGVETLIDIFHAIPSSVPSTTPDLETTGGIIGLEEVSTLLKHPKVVCLGEAMNFKGISYERDSLISRIIDLVKRERPTMPLEGHCPKITGQELSDFLYSGISSDHTHQFPETLKERIENGVFVQLQEKSLTPENMAVIVENGYEEYAALITDDVMADDLSKGHLKYIVREAIRAGLPLETALYMATWTPAKRMGLHDRGIIAPGKKADFSLFSDLTELSVHSVFKNGEQIVTQDTIKKRPSTAYFPDAFFNSVQARPLLKDDLTIRISTTKSTVRCHVLKKFEVGTFTECIIRDIPVDNGLLQWEEAGYGLIVVMERYGKNQHIAYALIEKPLNETGAICTTWAHDHHNLMVMGNNLSDMLVAQHKVLSLNGGYVVSHRGRVIGECPLPLGGILSMESMPVLSQQLQTVRRGMQQIGYRNFNEIMSFSTLSLPVSPAIKMTDRGMMNTKDQTFYPFVLPEDGVLLNENTY